MLSSRFTGHTRFISLHRLLVQMVRSRSLLLILLLIPELSCPSIIVRDQSREFVASEALTAGLGASGGIDATASQVFPNAGPDISADMRVPAVKQAGKTQRLPQQGSVIHSAPREISSFYLLVIVMIFALFIELTGNRFR